MEESVEDIDAAIVEIRLAEGCELPDMGRRFRVFERGGATAAPKGGACFLARFVLDGEEATGVLLETGLVAPMICGRRDGFRGAGRKGVEEGLRFVAFVDLFDLAGEAQIHADETGAAELVGRAAFAFPEVELAEFGGDDVREAGAEAGRRHGDLVEGDLTDVPAAAEHVHCRRIGAPA